MAAPVIDLRSDTVSRPTEAMRAAMAEAEVGDDTWGDDPTVQRLEAVLAERLGKDAAMFVPSGTQSNLCALMAHCARGEEYIVGQEAHTYKYEGGGAAVLGSIQPQPIEMAADGSLDPARVAAVVKVDDPHFAMTKLLCLENTHNGRVQPMDAQLAAIDAARSAGLSTHLDGARIFNAAVATGTPVADLAAPYDSVSVCLSKGLGAPMGSVLVGDGELIGRARRVRKMLGGGLRQAGLVAAAGLHALDHHVDRLAEDHARARRLHEGLGAIDGVEVHDEMLETNMVFVSFGARGPSLQAELAEIGMECRLSTGVSRLVTHLDVTDDAVDAFVAAVAERV